MIVVDTNVIAYACLENPLRPAALKLAQTDPHWRAPALWRSEMRNLLAGYLRKGRMNVEQAAAIFTEADWRMGTRLDLPNSAAVLRLVMTCRCTAYDLEFVALAQQLAVPLVTMDRELLAAFPDVARPLPG